jgi:GntR family transcriptional repressor for pyruvate dehydrogenase complex
VESVFPKIGKKQTLGQEIQHKIEEAIINKKFLPGQKLPTENEMCEMFAVSRTALREALQMLSARGLINVRKGSGIYIEDYDPKHVIRPMRIYLELNLDKEYLFHIINVRKIIEPPIVRLAVKNRTEEDIKKFEKNLDDQRNCANDDFKREGLLDRDFHLIIANASGNPMIPIMVEPIFQIMPRVKMMVYSEVKVAKKSALTYHSKIFELIKNQDEQGAYDAMCEHIRLAEEHIKIISAEL